MCVFVSVCGALGKKAYDDIEILSNIHMRSHTMVPRTPFANSIRACSFDSTRACVCLCAEESAALMREIHVTHM